MAKNISILIALALIPAKVFSQNNLLKIDIHSPIGRTGILSYERVLNQNSTLGISFLYSEDTEIFNADYLDRIAISPEYRFYLQEKHPAPRGFYLIMLLRYQHMTALEYSYEIDTGTSWEEKTKDNFGAAIGLGYQTIFKERIVLDMHLGTIFNSGEEKNEPDEYYNYDKDLFEPYAGYFIISSVKVGFVF